MTTASISVIDKGKKDGHWAYHEIEKDGTIAKLGQLTGSNYKILPYENRGKVWAMRGMSPGTQKVFTLTEGNRIHMGLSHDDVVPCVTSLRETPRTLKRLNRSAFRKHFIDAGVKCWLIRSNTDNLSSRLRAYLDNVPEDLRDTWTCTSRDLWYRYSLSDPPGLLVSMGFTSFGPKIIVNSIKAHAVGSVCGVYAQHNIAWSRLRAYLTAIDFEKRIVSHAKVLKKVEIRQFNAVLNEYLEQGKNYAKDKV